MHPVLLKTRGLESPPPVLMLVALADGRRFVMQATTTFEVARLFGRAASIQRTLSEAQARELRHLPLLTFQTHA